MEAAGLLDKDVRKLFETDDYLPFHRVHDLEAKEQDGGRIKRGLAFNEGVFRIAGWLCTDDNRFHDPAGNRSSRSRYTDGLHDMTVDITEIVNSIKRCQESGENQRAKELEHSAATRLKNKAGVQKASGRSVNYAKKYDV